MTTETPAQNNLTPPPTLTAAERDVLLTLEHGLRTYELPMRRERNPAHAAVAARVREYLAAYPGYEAVGVGVPLATAFNSDTKQEAAK